LTLLLTNVEKAKIGATERPRSSRAIRSGTDKTIPSRDLPRAVRRGVWRRDVGQCAYVSSTGRRCAESTFLEFHHVQPFARGGPARVDHISLRCRRHNQYEAELVFGRRPASAPTAIGSPARRAGCPARNGAGPASRPSAGSAPS